MFRLNITKYVKRKKCTYLPAFFTRHIYLSLKYNLRLTSLCGTAVLLLYTNFVINFSSNARFIMLSRSLLSCTRCKFRTHSEDHFNRDVYWNYKNNMRRWKHQNEREYLIRRRPACGGGGGPTATGRINSARIIRIEKPFITRFLRRNAYVNRV